MILSQDIVKIIQDNNNLPLFRFKQFNKDEYLLTNEVGEYVFLKNHDFLDFLQGKIQEGHLLYGELIEKSFLRTSSYKEVLVEKYKKKNSYLFWPTSLHIMVLTLRCNHKCQYCHASVGGECDTALDMTKDTAAKVIDTIFSSPGNSFVIEFQGGEPTLNWDTLIYAVQYTREKERKTGKKAHIILVTNLSTMDDEKKDFLVDNFIGLSTSLDGPEEVHNENRIWANGNSFQKVLKWIPEISAAIKKKEKQLIDNGQPVKLQLPGLLPTLTRRGLEHIKELVDLHVQLGMTGIALRALNPIGYAQKSWNRLGYTTEEYIEAYKNTLDYIIEINQGGYYLEEKMTKILLGRILAPIDPAFTDLRSPCGGGIGQIAYDIQGDIYTCDEGRMIGRMGDSVFQMGTVENTWQELINSDGCKSICSLSCNEGIAGLSDHVYKTYIGDCPAYNYASSHGNMKPNFYESSYYKRYEKMIDIIFEKLREPKVKEVFDSWLKR